MHRGGALGWLLKDKWGRERVSYRQKKGHVHIPGGVKVHDLFRKWFGTAAAKEGATGMDWSSLLTLLVPQHAYSCPHAFP